MKRKNPIVPSSQQLPIDFAERVLKLEISVDVGHSLEALKLLLELYSVLFT